ncbi:MAG: hypothetical protein PHG89_04670 [Gallionella sp.]|nr:hypothetical protein [Gallionella sp.]
MFTKEQALFIIGAVAIPVILFVMNLILRRAFQRPLTAAADWFLLAIAFDATAILAIKDLQPLISDQLIRDIAVATFLVLLLISIVAWLLSVGILEKKLEQAYGKNQSAGIIGWFGLSWGIAACVTAVNVLVFTWKTTTS